MFEHGVAIGLVWESTATRMRGGAAAGRSDAAHALALAADLGVPESLPVFFAADFDATPQDQRPVDAYLTAAAVVLGRGRVGLYAGYWPLSRAFDNGTAAWGWQTTAWSGGNIEPRAHLYQYHVGATVEGASVDLDRVLLPGLPLWAAPDRSRG